MEIIYVYPHGKYSTEFSKKNGAGCAGSTSSIDTKISCQIDALNKVGCNASLNELQIALSSPISYLKSSINAYKSLKKVYDSIGSDGVIYYRTMLPYLANYLCIRKRHTAKIVYELQDIEIDTAKIQLARVSSFVGVIRCIYIIVANRLFEKKIERKADGLVAVTDEITNYYKNKIGASTQYLTLGNGITVEKIPMRHIYTKNENINVLSVSSVESWHGLDRFILGLASYMGDREICLHIVGNGPEIPHLKELVEKYNLSTKVVFHGFKSGVELDEMFDMCQIGLDSLGSHRKNLSEASSLKAREYCARGIPFIMAHKDTDFPDEWPYVMHVPSDDSPIGMDIVISFADAMAMDLNHPVIMRKYAEDHLSWDAKMKMLKEFLESL